MYKRQALFRPVAGRADGILGYVRYAYDPGSLWQRLGSFFVGIAPMVLGVAAILPLSYTHLSLEATSGGLRAI